jgi:hypothetical protein
MSTLIRPEVSENNKYYISKQRYYELKHFCMQYGEWKRALKDISSLQSLETDRDFIVIGDVAKPVEKIAELRERYLACIEMVKKAAEETDKDLARYLLIGVTEGVAYDFLLSRLEIPCSKDTYYDRYRRFFWILDQSRK